MKLEERRYQKLTRAGFSRAEANTLKTERITDPGIKALMKERRSEIREARQSGSNKREYQSRIRSERALSGETVRDDLAFIRRRPDVAEKIRRQEFIEGGFRNRYTDLKRAGFSTIESRTLARMAHISPDQRDATFKTSAWQDMIASHAELLRLRIQDIADQDGISIAEATERYYDHIEALYGEDPNEAYQWIRDMYARGSKINSQDYIPNARRAKK